MELKIALVILFVTFFLIGFFVGRVKYDKALNRIATLEYENTALSNINNNYKKIMENMQDQINRRDDFIAGYEKQIEQMKAYIQQTDDFDSLCRIIQAESENQDKETQQKVAETVLNKAISSKNTITYIVYTTDQFSSVSDGRIYKCNGKGYEDVAMQAIMNKHRIDALWFCDDSEKDFQSKFSQEIEIVNRSGNMLFWRLKDKSEVIKCRNMD